MFLYFLPWQWLLFVATSNVGVSKEPETEPFKAGNLAFFGLGDSFEYLFVFLLRQFLAYKASFNVSQAPTYPTRPATWYLTRWGHFDVIGSIIFGELHFWHHLFNMAKILSKFGEQQLVWWIMRVVLTNKTEREKYFEWIIIAHIPQIW